MPGRAIGLPDGSEYFDQPRFETVVRHGVVGDDGAVGLVAWALSRV